MKLKDIYFGSIDAKEELTGEEKRESFVRSFLLPENIDLDDFKKRDKYILQGIKGTGKTAMLRYMDILFKKEPDVESSFVLFKSDFTEDDRKLFSRDAANVISKNGFTNSDETVDFENMWMWFFLKYIVNFCEKNTFRVFDEKDENWTKLVKCFSSIGKRISEFLPRITEGKIELEVSAIKVMLGFEPKTAQTNFLDIVRKAEDLFEDLRPCNTGKRLYIFLDELELEYTNENIYNRDVKIIRDLIVVVKKLNDICARKGFPVYCIVSVRSEVLTAVEAVGKEINKIVEDYGMLISWQQSGGNQKEHPLIRIIMKRLLAAENLEETAENIEKMYNSYFPDKEIMGKIPVERYILYNSWYRPRDIVRFLKLAQTDYPNETAFTQKVFDAIRKKYSTSAWTDCLEEMKADYSSERLQAIASIFTGWYQYFSYADFEKRLAILAKEDSRIEEFIENKEVRLLLERLYRMGIIGNSYRDGYSTRDTRIRFIFRGDENLLLDKDMMLHKALIPYFSAIRRPRPVQRNRYRSTGYDRQSYYWRLNSGR